MRSGTPKMLHPLCGRPMVLHVLDALAALPLDRIVVVVGHGAEDVAKTVQEQLVTDVPVEFVEQAVQRGTGDAVAVGLTAFADDLDGEDDVLVVFADAPLLRSETLAMLATEHRLGDAAATLLTARLDDPTSYGRVVRDAGGHVARIVEEARRLTGGARDRRGEPVDLLLPAGSPRAGVAPPRSRERAGRVLPHRRHRGAAAGRPRRRRHRGRRPHGGRASQRPGPARDRRGGAARPDQRPVDAGRRHDGRPRPAPTSTPSVELEADVRLLPGTHPRRAHGRAQRLRDRARRAARRHHRRARRRDPPDGRVRDRVRRPGHLRPLRVAAARNPRGRRRAPRHVRRGEEQRDRRRRQGAPPLLCGRRRHRRAHQHRGGEHHRQLRRPAQAPHQDRQGRPERVEHGVRRSGRGRRRRAHRARARSSNRDVPPGAMAKGVPARIEEDWAAKRDNDAADDGENPEGE